MNNVKTVAVANDGNMKRIAVTYDVIDDTGKVIESNKRVNRIVTDDSAIASINALETFAATLLE